MIGQVFESAIAAARADAPGWLRPKIDVAAMALAATPIPNRKSEHWKYAPLTGLVPPELEANNGHLAAAAAPDLCACRIEVTRQGIQVNGSPSGQLPPGVKVRDFSDLDELGAARVLDLMGSAAKDRSGIISTLSDATLGLGLWIDIADDADISTPLQLIWQQDSTWLSARLLVTAGRNCRASIIEHFGAGSLANSQHHGVTELFLAAGANLDYCRSNTHGSNQTFFGGVFAKLSRDATLTAFAYAAGAKLCRNEWGLVFAEAGAHAELNGIYLPAGREVVDFHTTLEHAAAHCTSEETFRGIIGDRANAIFNGRIHIHPDAQKTVAQLSNKNLLTSDQAQVNTKPELEIYANDVQCAHGATVAQINDEAIHYCRTRGITESVAAQLIGIGFVVSLFDRIAYAPLRDWLSDQARQRCLTLVAGDASE